MYLDGWDAGAGKPVTCGLRGIGKCLASLVSVRYDVDFEGFKPAEDVRARETLDLETALRDAFGEIERQLSVFSLVTPHLEKLNDFVCHMVKTAEQDGDLTPGELPLGEVVDAVLLRAYEEFVKQRPSAELGGWLIGLAVQQLDADIKRLQAERNEMIHVEEDGPETSDEDDDSVPEDEKLNLYRPDEDLKLALG